MSFSIKKGDSEISGDFSQLQDLIKELKTDYYVDIGILGSEVDSDSGLTIAGIGLVQEVGTENIEQRSFIKMPLTEKGSEIQETVSNRMQKHLEDGNVKGIFTDIGIAGESAIQEAFDTKGFGSWPPNKPSTVKQKGSNSPLIVDGTLRKSITSKVGK